MPAGVHACLCACWCTCHWQCHGHASMHHTGMLCSAHMSLELSRYCKINSTSAHCTHTNTHKNKHTRARVRCRSLHTDHCCWLGSPSTASTQHMPGRRALLRAQGRPRSPHAPHKLVLLVRLALHQPRLQHAEQRPRGQLVGHLCRSGAQCPQLGLTHFIAVRALHAEQRCTVHRLSQPGLAHFIAVRALHAVQRCAVHRLSQLGLAYRRGWRAGGASTLNGLIQ